MNRANTANSIASAATLSPSSMAKPDSPTAQVHDVAEPARACAAHPFELGQCVGRARGHSHLQGAAGVCALVCAAQRLSVANDSELMEAFNCKVLNNREGSVSAHYAAANGSFVIDNAADMMPLGDKIVSLDSNEVEQQSVSAF